MTAEAIAREVLTFARAALLAGGAGGAGTWRVVPLAGDGSGRRYFRVFPAVDRGAAAAASREALAPARARGAAGSRVVIVNLLVPGRTHPDENEGFVAIREFLAARGVRVPAIEHADLGRGFLLIEDLGDERLCDRVAREGWSGWPGGSLRGLYAEVMHALARAHAPASPEFRPEIAPNPPYTEPFILEWEAGYFHAEFVGGWARLERRFDAIEGDCRKLAREALAGSEEIVRRRVFMHRDYQSRNIMVIDSKIAVIDFQGGRIGPPEYDLAAILYDPYVSMPEEARRDLIACYAEEAAALGVPGVPAPGDGAADAAWRRRFLASAANRLMQALGAYGKLGGRFGRPGFLEHIPAALAALDRVLAERGDCPELLALCRELRARELPAA